MWKKFYKEVYVKNDVKSSRCKVDKAFYQLSHKIHSGRRNENGKFKGSYSSLSRIDNFFSSFLPPKNTKRKNTRFLGKLAKTNGARAVIRSQILPPRKEYL